MTGIIMFCFCVRLNIHSAWLHSNLMLQDYYVMVKNAVGGWGRGHE